MSKTTIALEAAVADVIANTAEEGARPTPRQRAAVDRAFATALTVIAPRIRHFIRQYGLIAHWDDAEQCCAIAVHRAIQAYNPEKAQFTTFVNWQIRGELQSLRFRLMTDQRPSAKKVAATTVSIHAVTAGAEGEEMTLESMIQDENALASTEAGASAYLAKRARDSLVNLYVEQLRDTGTDQIRARAKRSVRVTCEDDRLPRYRARPQAIDPAQLAELEARIADHRDVVERRIFEDLSHEDLGGDDGLTKERARQLTKRAAKTMAELAQSRPEFALMADYGPRAVPARKRKAALPMAAVALLPSPNQAHNDLARVVSVACPASVGEQPRLVSFEDRLGSTSLTLPGAIVAPRTCADRVGSVLH